MPSADINGRFYTQIIVVEHGADASAKRPAWSGVVSWRGTVTPTNMIDGDEFIDLS